MTETKILYKKPVQQEGQDKKIDIKLPPIQDAEVPETLSPEVARLYHHIPYDHSMIVFLEYLNNLENAHLLSEESYGQIIQRLKFYRKTLPLSFFNQIESIVSKVLKHNPKALNEFNKIKEGKYENFSS